MNKTLADTLARIDAAENPHDALSRSGESGDAYATQCAYIRMKRDGRALSRIFTRAAIRAKFLEVWAAMVPHSKTDR